MSVERARLLAVVGHLAARERGLVLAAAGARGLAWLGGVLATSAVLARLDPSRGEAAAWLVLVAGAGAWFVVGAPLRASWGRALDPLRQARLVEAREPGLRGRLVTVVGHAEGSRGAESPVLLELAARRARPLVERHPAEVVHPASGLRGPLVAAALAWLVAGAASLGGEGGASGIARWWVGRPAGTDGAVADAADALPPARVGDLTLRYVYPAYTGLEPYEVVNSTGEVHAPPGTRVEVTARSADVVEAATLRAYDLPAVDAEVRDGRVVVGSFVVGPVAGAWRILVAAGGETRASKAFPVVPEPDLAPQVSLVADGEVVEVAVDQPLGLAWSASDDFGIARVLVRVEGVDGRLLREPRERLRQVEDVLTARPVDLGLEVGRAYQLSVAAWDNDTVAGSKVGVSNVVRVVVLGEGGVSRLDDAGRDELIDLLLEALAGFLVEPFPPGPTAGKVAAWGETSNRRLAALSAFLDARKGTSFQGREWGPVLAAAEDGLVLVRFTQTAFLPGSTDPPNPQNLEALVGLRDDAIAGLENAILHLDAIVRGDAMQEAAETAERLSGLAEGLEADLARLDSDAMALAVRAEGLEGFVERFAAFGERLGEGSMQGLVERSAQETRALVEELRGALSGADRAEAARLGRRLAERLRETAAILQDELERMREQADQRRSKGQDVLAELRALVDRQDALAAQLAEVRAEADEASRRGLADLWKQLDAAVAGLEAGLERHHTDLKSDPRTFNEAAFVGEARARAADVAQAAGARDPSGVERSAFDVEELWERYAIRHGHLVEAGLAAREPGRTRISETRRAIGAVLDLVGQLRRRDAELAPAMRAPAQALVGDQGSVSSRLREVRGQAEELVRQLPVTPRDLLPSLDSAERRMGEAGEQLRAGEAMQAQGSQGAASEHLRDAIKALRDAMQQSQSQQPSPGGEGGGGRPQEGEQDGAKKGADPSEESGPARFDLPEPEEFRTPEAYRKALLEGMEGDVPDAYRALKQRYYEELVHQ